MLGFTNRPPTPIRAPAVHLGSLPRPRAAPRQAAALQGGPAAFKPRQIILFGSYAYGTPTEDSDVDVLVVMAKSQRLGHRPALRIREKVEADFPVDVVVRDPAFVRDRLREGDCFLEEITRRGKVMYESSHA